MQYWLIEESKLRLLIRERDVLRKFNGVLIFFHEQTKEWDLNEYVMTDMMC